MCGLFGILSLNGPLLEPPEHYRVHTDVIAHRGPDDFGFHMDHRIYLGHRRLSIIDLDSGKQPIYNEDRTKCIVFNGEIFNYREIKKELEGKGHCFRTNSDTEVILHAYEEFGEKCLKDFRGMFAFAIWDARAETLFLARDRMGIKPLFYAEHNGTLMFASEMKSILAEQNIDRMIDRDAMALYFILSYIPGKYTIYRSIRKLLPGHYLVVRNKSIKISQYWDVSFCPDYSKSEKQFIDGFMTRFEEAVRLRMISDVPIGAFLSGGVDSGAVVAMMSRSTPDPIRTYCIGFGGNIGGFLDERVYARQVSERYGTIHHEYEVQASVEEIIENVVRSFDEPFADAGAIPNYYVCKATSEHVKVALSGLGGDELFGGYERYLGVKLSQYYMRIPAFARKHLFEKIVGGFREREDGHYTINHMKRFIRNASVSLEEMYTSFVSILGNVAIENFFSDGAGFRGHIENAMDFLGDQFGAENASDPLDKAFYFDFKTYLPEDILACTDRMSMKHSIEVRVPFLDHKLVEYCGTIPARYKIKNFQKKFLLKAAMKDVLPKTVLSHRKQGFIGPMGYWFHGPLKKYIEKELSKDNLDRHGFFDRSIVESALKGHYQRKEMYEKLLWALVVFQVWYRCYQHDLSVPGKVVKAG